MSNVSTIKFFIRIKVYTIQLLKSFRYSFVVEYVLSSSVLGFFKHLKNEVLLTGYGQRNITVLYQTTNDNVHVNINKGNC